MTGTPTRTDIRLAGAGGQGVVLAGVILAEAAMLDGRRVAVSQAYGPQSRGGASRADVIIGPDIGFPVTDNFDILLALSREAYRRYAKSLRKNGLLIADDRRIGALDGALATALLLPIEAVAQRAAGSAVAANVVALGALSGRTGIVPAEALEAAVRSRVPARTWPMNHRALRAGYELGRTKER